MDLMSSKPPGLPDISSLTTDAEAGIPGAQFNLGLAWLYGDAGSRDPARAWLWLEKAANQGIAEARAALGTMCLNGNAGGHRGKSDIDQARAHLEQAYADGSCEAGFRLGHLLLTGLGVSPDPARGASMIETAARQGHMLALTDAAWCLEHGLGLTRNPARALRAWQLAASAGMPRGWFVLGTWLLEGRFVRRDPALARACLEQAAAQDYPLAAVVAGEIPDGDATVDARRALELAMADPEGPVHQPPAPEVLCASPQIHLLHGFIPLEVRAHLIDRARRLIEPSRVLTRDGTVSRKAIRTSGEMSFLPEIRDVTIWHLEQRLHAAVDVPVDNGEPLIILHYTPGTEYKPHYDYFDPADPGHAQGLRHGGQRIFTLLSYLSPVTDGGATAFPELGLKVSPEPGAVLMFRNVTDSGRIDPRTLHAGLPVERGEKWLATRWIREQRFIREPDSGSRGI